MISDVLFEAVDGVDRYLENPLYDSMYCGELRERIIKLRNDMAQMQRELDTPPGAPILPIVPFEMKQSVEDVAEQMQVHDDVIATAMATASLAMHKTIAAACGRADEPMSNVYFVTFKELVERCCISPDEVEARIRKFVSIYYGPGMRETVIHGMLAAIEDESMPLTSFTKLVQAVFPAE
ncbi:hypothetical protein [Ralstonia phage RP31]|uniref:Uncharacterized protein n=2 Tax=Ripduovirus RP12 TaxID=2560700 RepID=A0A1L7N1J8_9CAUD|nr:hypothetical protein FDH28_gp251 [Ralstonia phage RP12]BAW19144.1 hypothetical protein [Ralstonia phage RP12]BAW19430.1 hypothetical protein [Ralstonia phage RP31]